MTTHDQKFMQEALVLARLGQGRTSPNPAVGAVVVHHGQVVGRGYHRAAGQPHAEIEALTEAGDLSRGATIYVTLEPCNHQGRTGPCTHAILAAGIARVVYAVADPFKPASGGGKWLEENGIPTTSGVLEDSCRSLNEPFFTRVNKNRPMVLLKMASTLDGHIAERTGKSKYITGPQALERVHQLRNILDAVIIGANTAKKDNPRLTCLLEGEHRDPLRVLVDSSLGSCTDGLLLTTELAGGTIVFTSRDADPGIKERIQARGVLLMESPTPIHTPITPVFILEQLHALGVNSVLLEGGSALATSFLLARLVDRIMIFMAPKLLVDTKAPLMIGTDHPFSLDILPSLVQTTVEMVGQDILMEGKVDYPKEWP
ncbi:bifunctional diaminohydroxyphosphoribosylaminopyrimidine deaminase/5-amino-6-(5-phosphoribosylamino)uracil reductase RibD [Myxococcota bacterium]|nr:bifunctional diaminohydroxyphosphoribosylaminopyrimidine deaminase/5-amino-6-(5-phosphoribosylamino)uracil reductase RibD [Myxococcota bacterium]